MEELLRDIEKLINESDALSYIRDGGGVVILQSLDQFPHQHDSPMIVLISGGTPEIIHYSSRGVRRNMTINIHCIQRAFNRQEIVAGGEHIRGIESISKDVRELVNLERFGGKYMRAILTGEAPVEVLVSERNPHLQEKALTFQFSRLES